MSSSESSYTWDDWHDRQNLNNKKNHRLDEQQIVRAAAKSIKTIGEL